MRGLEDLYGRISSRYFRDVQVWGAALREMIENNRLSFMLYNPNDPDDFCGWLDIDITTGEVLVTAPVYEKEFAE